jgi:hypothetical protein
VAGTWHRGLARVFADDASYLRSPYKEPDVGLGAISRMWDQERDGPGEIFTLATEIVAVDGATAVVRAEVRYGDPVHQEYRDLWVMRLGDDGRCTWFEEWPYWPVQPALPGRRPFLVASARWLVRPSGPGSTIL